MNRIQEIKHWLDEGNLNLAEKAIQDCTQNLKPEEKEDFEALLNEISVHNYRLLAGKAVAAQDEKLLQICVEKLREKNAHVEGLQNSLNQIITERRNIRYQKYLVIIFGLIIFLFIGILLFSR
jgi:hypothetical protein